MARSREVSGRLSSDGEPPSDEQIARRAHEIYERRGGDHGHDLEDWLQAERELRDARPASALPVGAEASPVAGGRRRRSQPPVSPDTE